MATILTEPDVSSDVLLWEADAGHSREAIILRAGQVYPVGAVLGQVAGNQQWTLSPAAPVAGIEGAETAGAVLLVEVDATAAPAPGLVSARNSTLAARSLKYHATVADAAGRAAKHDQLAMTHLVVRE